MEYDYNEMLERIYKNLPEKVRERVRFEIPKVESFIQGNRTIVTNLTHISNYLKRDINHLLKFLSRELATSGNIEDYRVIFTGRFPTSLLNSKIEKYVNEFVICAECKKPDTRFEKEDRITFIKCLACGARKPIRAIK
ncbi:MAG: translation initiation factor IF-2 subunit beta [Candidatus Parvarchaeota archaeon]|nr:translation initiation factor IF-2 subunit beta [Candidatus Jingweiarchaeum tengchongense]MCW1300109.1 translation initiation factor IF-2 subunit beta [Candidatus Jingweiarchaeum tengchongense]MCW1304463.1 translation initiation factor IF-2 subunit beta [Candidatus Jingweiarchaeum tengchongense]MCW1305630.1 translation initiation factor IF-2 subunit beta [Candidatus Jingweiarchaeum tengchongense]MCW1311010.1 translation initiation factor IF-2 subunit beta [Candidatus Jingweiarchaeum tengchon